MDVFQELSWFFDDPADVDNLISGSSAFSQSSLNICKFTVHVLLKRGLENLPFFPSFPPYFASHCTWSSFQFKPDQMLINMKIIYDWPVFSLLNAG